MDNEAIRQKSLSKAKRLGYPVNSHLPLLGDIKIERSLEEFVDRMLCLYTCVACSYGLPKKMGWAWLAQEGLLEKVTTGESLYLREKDPDAGEKYKTHVETIWAMTWIAGLQDELEFDKTCTNEMVSMFPNLKASASSEAFRSKCQLRDLEEVVPKIDLAYCLHWAVGYESLNKAEIPKKPKRIRPYIIVNRRLALEWLVCDDPWDEVHLDT
ncbi:DUF4272 domain-containing protein [Bremerella cremea]|uniref:DUF4272 domain-containing protein n=1 Tax=Bremerella cremea TaxID=1031537 RepID=UPI0031EC3E5A